jgi:hypothetical protein
MNTRILLYLLVYHSVTLSLTHTLSVSKDMTGIIFCKFAFLLIFYTYKKCIFLATFLYAIGTFSVIRILVNY